MQESNTILKQKDRYEKMKVMKLIYAVFISSGFVVHAMLFFLQETKLINHKSLKLVQENEQHIREIEEILKKDRRYLVLDYMPDERTKLIVTYLEDLDKRGPPPPPTASEPTRRPTK